MDHNCYSEHTLLNEIVLRILKINYPSTGWIYFEIAKFHVKRFKAQKIQREYNEKQNEFNVQNELQKLEQQVTSNVKKEFEKNSQQTKELETKLEKKFEEIERKLESNFETTKKLEDKLEEILKILKPEWD